MNELNKESRLEAYAVHYKQLKYPATIIGNQPAIKRKVCNI